jgi:hypothetical protein
MQYNNGTIPMMTVDKTKPKNLARHFNALKDRWLPWIKVNVTHDALHYEVLRAGQWIRCNTQQLPAFTVFAKLTLLLPAPVCAYRIRTFPQHMLSAKELEESIALDYPHWSPWGQDSGYCYSYTAVADDWQVSIWVWDQQYAQNLLQQVPFCTHIIPELAWYAASAPPHPALMVVSEQNGFNYLLLGDAGKIQATARITGQQQAQRCWHGWGMPATRQGWEINQPHDYWSPETVNMQPLPLNHTTPQNNLLRITRIPGVRDWADPGNYQAIFKLLLISLFSWMTVDALVLNQQTRHMQAQLNLIRTSADEVLALREQVETARRLNQQAQQLQQQQRQPEQMLAQLSTRIPNDIYLKNLQMEGDQLDLDGQGKQVARLMVLLEKLPNVAKVMLINDIRRNASTDEELFQIRLILKAL